MQDQEPVLAADHGMLDGVFDQLAARPHGGELGLPVGGVGVADLDVTALPAAMMTYLSLRVRPIASQNFSSGSW